MQSNYTACSSAHVPHSTSSPNASKKDDDKQNGLDPKTKQSANVQCTLPSWPQKNVVNKVQIIMNHHTYLTVPLHLTFPCCILQKLTHCWKWRLTATITDKEPSPEYDVTHAKMLVFLAITVKICYGLHVKLTTGQQWTSFTHLSIGT